MKNFTDLSKIGGDRKRLTGYLRDVIALVADEIAENVPDDTEVYVAGNWLNVYSIDTNVGCLPVLGVQVHDCFYRVLNISTGECGETYFLYGDFQAPYTIASLEEFLWFANNIVEIVKAFEKYEVDLIRSLEEGLASLKGIID